MAKTKVLIYKANHSFWLGEQLVRAGDSVVAGHPLLKGRMALFEPFQPTVGRIDWATGEAEKAAPKPAPEPTPEPEPIAEPEPETPAEGGDA